MTREKNASPAPAKTEQSKATGLQLAKNSDAEIIKAYFSKIFDLKQTGKQFPVDLDDVWPLIYDRKDHAVRILRSDFVENEDYVIQRPENHLLPKNGEQKVRGGHNRLSYYLSVECLEYFIVKKIKPIFEVYRQVFHKVVEGNSEQAKNSADFHPVKQKMLSGRNHNRLSPARLIDILADVALIEQKDLRERLVTKLILKGGRI